MFEPALKRQIKKRSSQVVGCHFKKWIDGRFDRVEGRLDHVEKGLRDLRHEMPGIVGSAMREVLRERRRDK